MKTKIEFSDEELKLLQGGNLDEKLDGYSKMLFALTYGKHRFENELDACFYDYQVAKMRYKIVLIRQLKVKLYSAEKESK